MNKIMKRRLTIISAMIIPGSGHVILKKPVRGLMLVFWMLAMGFITYNITEESISFIGRYSGGFLVYLLSILEVWKISK